MRIIAGHVNADFDVLASMVAAWKLYPDALMVFTGAQEKAVRDFLSTNPVPHLTFYNTKDIDLDSIREIILVDTRFSSRIGSLKELTDKKKIRIISYDHHPTDQGDIKPDEYFHRDIGSTATILVTELKKRKIKLTPNEATVIAIGIYEDTGSLTYVSTRKEDLMAVSYLLDCGATLADIPSYINLDLNREQLQIFADIIKAMEYHTIDGVQIGISCVISSSYMGDLALFIHKLKDIGHIPAVFIIAQLKDRVQIVARSQTRAVNISIILNELGGGGHRTAGSAVMRDTTADEVKVRLLELLNLYVEPMIRAREMMSSPVMTITPELRVDQVRKLILRYHHDSYPVIKGKEILGIISSLDIGHAYYLGYGKEQVDRFINREFILVDVQASFRQVRELMTKPEVDLIGVTEPSGRLVGVISRSDILKATHEAEDGHKKTTMDSQLPVDTAKLRIQNLKELLDKRIHPYIHELLLNIGNVGEKMHFPTYLVGGFVRDLMLEVPNYDLDIVVEGDGITFARHLARKLKGRVKSHKRFNTAIVTTPDHLKIDVATARTEFYEFPAALPVVESSTIKHDLYRRDFTINAMAMKLNPEDFGLLYDYFNGIADLKHGRIRVLHNLSFVEDPTRIFRAIRFEQRYGFKMDKQTRMNIANALELDIFSRLGNERVREEIILILSEKDPWKAIKRMRDLKVLPFIHPDIMAAQETERLFKRSREFMEWFHQKFPSENCNDWEVYFLCLMDSLDWEQSNEVCKRLVMIAETESLLKQLKSYFKEYGRKIPSSQGELYAVCKNIRTEGILYLLAQASQDWETNLLKEYFETIRFKSIHLSGKDLIKMGLQPGPLFKEILDSLTIAKINGLVNTPEEELEWVKQEYKTFKIKPRFQRNNQTKMKP